MHHIVLDEADLLLSGGFERDVGRILEGMKQSDKERKAQCVSQELGLPLGHFQALPRHVKAAAYEGKKSSCEGIMRTPPCTPHPLAKGPRRQEIHHTCSPPPSLQHSCTDFPLHHTPCNPLCSTLETPVTLPPPSPRPPPSLWAPPSNALMAGSVTKLVYRFWLLFTYLESLKVTISPPTTEHKAAVPYGCFMHA